jgi:hypothetical protein
MLPPLVPMLKQRPATELERVVDDGDLAVELDRLARHGDPQALRHFRSALGHPAAVVQIAAAAGIAECGNHEDIPALLEQLRSHAPAAARPAMIAALGAVGDLRCVPALIEIVREPREHQLHAVTAAALGRLGAHAALPFLDDLAASRERGVREAAAVASQAIRLGRSRETYEPIARLAESLARFDSLLAHPSGGDTSDPRLAMVDPIGALTQLGVSYDGTVPHDLAVWARWCNRPAPALRWASSRGWHFLSLADALALRAALRLGDADAGPWLPIMASDFGDHQVYVPRSYREGVVYSVFSDERFRLGGDCKPLVDHAHAIIDAWTTLRLT